MKTKTKLNTLCKNPYKHYYFWEHKITSNSNLWEGYFENEHLTKDSKIIYIGILNEGKNIFHQGFAAYPNVYKLLGFLQHVFLPTSFFTWFDCKSDNFYIPLASYHEVVNEVLDCTTNVNLNLVKSMNDSYNFLTNLWLLNDSLLTKSLNSFCEKFNAEWDEDFNKKIFIKIFNNPSNIFDFIKDAIVWSDFDEFVEEEISMSLDQLKFTCDNAIDEPLLNKKFIDILNTNIPILF